MKNAITILILSLINMVLIGGAVYLAFFIGSHAADGMIWLSKKLFKDHWYENGIPILFGGIFTIVASFVLAAITVLSKDTKSTEG